MKIAVVGTGVSGLVAAYLLSEDHELTVFESGSYPGGHTNTLDVSINGEDYRVDTGFIVYNEQNYPNFTRLLEILGVETQSSNMSFSVRCEATGLEYCGSSANSLFAQRRNLMSPAFWRMLWGILRFYREATELLESDNPRLTLGEYLQRKGYSKEFIDWHLVPMGSAVWSTGRQMMQHFPARQFVEFFKNHGFLDLAGPTEWRVIKGGSRSYVEAMTEKFRDRIRLNCPVTAIKRNPGGVAVSIADGMEHFDKVIVATHSDQAISLLSDPSAAECAILGAIPYQSNETVLHTDDSLLPRRKRARASWNYHLLPDEKRSDLPTVTYYMNMLQSIDSDTHFCVTLNRSQDIDPSKVIARLDFEHPVLTGRAIEAQGRASEINGLNHTYFCGAYWGYGFHEDGVKSGLEVAKHFGKGLR